MREEGMSTLAIGLKPPLPRSLYLETTSRCNSLCETCILTFGGREPQKDLGWEEFRRVVDQFPALDRVLLHGIGEPLLNRDLIRMIIHLKKYDATVLFNSNVITLGPRLRQELIESGLDELRVSLDASTPATLDTTRGSSWAISSGSHSRRSRGARPTSSSARPFKPTHGPSPAP